ncbi:UDP-glycosyltransferase 91C1-like isoform X3 [Canna indica]|uniref:UDP-glycosyltransferase 91C1-like isoform X3 n=1 Tax=Canna indica TaxID=4628 RepID=A0AAQ3QRI3_9LILI|nr:UDP-glycosyltransferase 91C1-like isoform X3 [Canna indica]
MDDGSLHIVMLPWLALGHLFPFMELSKRIAQHGHRISFFATPKNIRRLPRVPPHLSSLIHFVELRLPSVEHLPPDAEASIDLPSDDLRPYLRQAFDTFQHQLSSFLRQSLPRLPDWIVFDYAPYWAPRVAAEFGVPCAYLSLFNAAVLNFYGPPVSLMGGEGGRTTPEEFMEQPPWVPFESHIFYKPYEARELFKPGALPDASGVSEAYRFGKSMEDCQLIAIRSCEEFESNWLDVLRQLHDRPVIPVGFFPPSPQEADLDEESESRWRSICSWLDKQKPGSVVYAAFGSEVKLTSSQVREIALGLEKSELPFVCALRALAGSGGIATLLPEGFEEKTAGRGLLCVDWAPQVRILRHGSVGGFLTHGGWNSIIEGLSLGLAMVLLPLMFDQGLNARNLVGRGISVEVARDEEDGAFTGEGIARSLRLVMVEEEGEKLRAKAKEYREVFGDEEMNDGYVRQFIEQLEEHRRKEA